jgi:hypothetical protein
VGDARAQREIVSEGIYYALFRVVEIEELSGPEKAIEWARAMLDEPELRRGFTEGVLRARAERAERDAGPASDS